MTECSLVQAIRTGRCGLRALKNENDASSCRSERSVFLVGKCSCKGPKGDGE